MIKNYPAHICLVCKKEFNKKYFQSQNYWSTARYCSKSCGRLSNNPAKLKPNESITKNGITSIFILSKGKLHQCLIDEEDYNKMEIRNSRWTLSSYGYVNKSITVNNKHKQQTLHCMILKPVEGFVIDHINGNPLDNRKCNLRHLTHKNNIRNQKQNNKLGVNGVRVKPSGSFGVRIKVGDKEISLGTYKTLSEAVKNRIEGEKKYWGISFLEEKLSIGL